MEEKAGFMAYHIKYWLSLGILAVKEWVYLP